MRNNSDEHHVSRTTHHALFIVLLVYIVLAAWYSATIPLGEAPDEGPHFTYILFIAREGKLPEGPQEHEAFQPPLYYLLGAALVAPFDTRGFALKANADFALAPDAPKNLLLHTTAESFPWHGWALAWHVVRLLSVAMGAVTVAVIYTIGRHVFPDRPAIALGMATFAAFTPEFLFISAVTNNDNLATMLAALTLLQTIRITQGSTRLYDFIAAGLLLGLGVLAKTSLLALAPVLLVAILAAVWLRRHWLPAIAWTIAAFAPAALIAGPWFVRNQILYDDPLGWSLVLKANALRQAPLALDDFTWLAHGLFRSFWLAWIGIELDGWVYLALGLVTLAAALGLARLMVRWRDLTCETQAGLAILGLALALVVASLVQWTATVLGTDQARLLYPALPAIACFFVAGLDHLAINRQANSTKPAKVDYSKGDKSPFALLARRFIVGRSLSSSKREGQGGVIVVAFSVALLALAVVTPLRTIAPVYAPPPILAQPPTIPHTAQIDFGGHIRLLGFGLPSSQARPGDVVQLDLAWQALSDIGEDDWLLIQLLDQNDRFLMFSDGSPTAGRDTTDFWRRGEIRPSTHRLPIPDYAAPGRYHLALSIHPFGTRDWLAIADASGQPLGDRVILAEIEIIAPK